MEVFTSFDKLLEAIQVNPHPSRKKTPINSVFSSRKEFAPIKKYVEESFNSKKYKDSTDEDFIYTLKYCFDFMFKFLFVQIRDGKIILFAHVENTKFRNNWSSHLKTNAKTLKNKLKTFSRDTRRCGLKPLEDDMTKWTATNCFINTTKYESEGIGDTHYEKEIEYMIRKCCEKYKIPDVDLIINKKDSNFLRWDDKYSYDVYRSEKDPNQVGHKFYPILAIGSSIYHADIPIPYPQDWELASPIDYPWEDRSSIAVFRGASTGCGTTYNPRILAVRLSMKWKSENKNLLDAGITKENCRLRVNNKKEIEWMTLKKWKIPISPFMTREEQSKFKYILHIDGNIAAFRLAEDLQSGSLVLKVNSEFKVWFTELLVENKHYIPVKSDLSDLETKILWCREHDAECKTITENARELIKSIVTHERILQYWRYVIDMCLK